MTENSDDKKLTRVLNRRVHMANERTFLAWIRTSIGIMAFGFVVEKFALFMKEMTFLLDRSITGEEKTFISHGYSAILGIFLVGLGALMGGLAFIRYKKVRRQIDMDTWAHSILLDALLTICVMTVGVFLVIYLLYSL